ncbi:MAG: hypothetical protein AAGJ10_00030 [Bacteroidota bacterium]
MRSLCQRVLWVLLVWATLAPAPSLAQFGDPIRLYGYFQGIFRYSNETGRGVLNQDLEYASFALQQLNLMMAKDFSPSFSAFINLELTNTFSTQDGWGDFRVEEAWLQYRHSPGLRIHVGLQIPEFNNLNTIKNRTPLLPYIARPIAYESSFDDFAGASDFVPQNTYIRVSGTQPVGPLRLDYSVHVGNQEDFVEPEGSNTFPSGTDNSLAKMFGGRVGIRYQSLKLGFSTTSDSYTEDDNFIGIIDRYRFGVDLSFTVRRFLFESEWIHIQAVMSEAQRAQFDRNALENMLIGSSLDKRFIYATLGYYLTDQWFVYGLFSQLDDYDSALTEDGIEFYSAGITYRPIDQVSLKAQYLVAGLDAGSLLTYDGSYFFAGVSVLF